MHKFAFSSFYRPKEYKLLKMQYLALLSKHASWKKYLYCIYSEYFDTSTAYHNCPKIDPDEECKM